MMDFEQSCPREREAPVGPHSHGRDSLSANGRASLGPSAPKRGAFWGPLVCVVGLMEDAGCKAGPRQPKKREKRADGTTAPETSRPGLTPSSCLFLGEPLWARHAILLRFRLTIALVELLGGVNEITCVRTQWASLNWCPPSGSPASPSAGLSICFSAEGDDASRSPAGRDLGVGRGQALRQGSQCPGAKSRGAQVSEEAPGATLGRDTGRSPLLTGAFTPTCGFSSPQGEGVSIPSFISQRKTQSECHQAKRSRGRSPGAALGAGVAGSGLCLPTQGPGRGRQDATVNKLVWILAPFLNDTSDYFPVRDKDVRGTDDLSAHMS